MQKNPNQQEELTKWKALLNYSAYDVDPDWILIRFWNPVPRCMKKRQMKKN
jgi:hypothetical protein